ncbi:MAG: hypothetical protein ACREFE_05490 [Limisphaerales bacterium]
MRLHRYLKIVAHDFSRFVNVAAQFGGAIRGVNLNLIGVCFFADVSVTV